MTGSGWADSFAMTTVADFVSVLAPASAGSVLLKHGLQFSSAVLLRSTCRPLSPLHPAQASSRKATRYRAANFL